jgi:hypothetical protein
MNYAHCAEAHIASHNLFRVLGSDGQLSLRSAREKIRQFSAISSLGRALAPMFILPGSAQASPGDRAGLKEETFFVSTGTWWMNQ